MREESDDNDEGNNEEETPRLMIAVGVPAFNRRANKTSKNEGLLGVAATDVPVEDIKRLSLPYKVYSSTRLVHMHPKYIFSLSSLA